MGVILICLILLTGCFNAGSTYIYDDEGEMIREDISDVEKNQEYRKQELKKDEISQGLLNNKPADLLKFDTQITVTATAIVEGGRSDVANKSRYVDAYYTGGYPPEDEGVCTDLVWRALKNAGYSLKEMMDKDIRENPSFYPRAGASPDPNIDFRRVQNHIAFFSRFGNVLTKEIKPNDSENLKQWQAGDIVSIHSPEHIGIISDKRNYKGVPYVIHNIGPVPIEEDCLESWSGRITGHFRFPKN